MLSVFSSGKDAVCQIFGTLKIVKIKGDLVAVVCYLGTWKKDHMSSLLSWCSETMAIPYWEHEAYMNGQIIPLGLFQRHQTGHSNLFILFKKPQSRCSAVCTKFYNELYLIAYAMFDIFTYNEVTKARSKTVMHQKSSRTTKFNFFEKRNPHRETSSEKYPMFLASIKKHHFMVQQNTK